MPVGVAVAGQRVAYGWATGRCLIGTQLVIATPGQGSTLIPDLLGNQLAFDGRVDAVVRGDTVQLTIIPDRETGLIPGNGLRERPSKRVRRPAAASRFDRTGSRVLHSHRRRQPPIQRYVPFGGICSSLISWSGIGSWPRRSSVARALAVVRVKPPWMSAPLLAGMPSGLAPKSM
jgi:hypothetical protein